MSSTSPWLACRVARGGVHCTCPALHWELWAEGIRPEFPPCPALLLQDGFPGLDLRAHANGAGLKPLEYAARARNPVLLHLLDERLPVALLRQVWSNYSLDAALPPRHATLGELVWYDALRCDVMRCSGRRVRCVCEQQGLAT